MFGFGAGFFLLVKIPLFGVLVYGIAEASTAFLITKITDPPPPPSASQGFVDSQLKWENKKDFLKLPLEHLDAYNVKTKLEEQNPMRRGTELPSKKFT